MLRKFTTAAVAAISLASASASVAATSASSLSVANAARAGAKEGDSALTGGSGGIIAIALLLGIIAIPLVDELSDDNNDNAISR